MIESNIGKISKTHSPRSPKNTFWEVFQIKFFAINIKWTKWSQHQLIDRLWLRYKFLCSIFSDDSQSIDFIKPNINWTHKVKYIVKLMEVCHVFTFIGNSRTSMRNSRITRITWIFTRNSRIISFHISWINCKQYWQNHYKKGTQSK